MTDVEALVQKFVSVWNERDAAQRRTMIQNLWAKDGRHLMGAQDVRGHVALEQRVAASNHSNVVEKDYVFRPATAIATLPDMIKFRWDMARRQSGDVVAAGVGFLAIDGDGNIACDYLFTES